MRTPEGSGPSAGSGRAADDEVSFWTGRHAPSLAAFAVLAERAFASLPPAVRELCGEIVFRIEDWADDETLDALGIRDPLDLMGLFAGHGHGGLGDLATGQEPNAVTLYRRAIIDYWAEREETLDAVVTHVLVHEIGHHFGLSDADMEAIEGRS